MSSSALLAYSLICGGITYAIGTRKNFRKLPSFLWGLFLGIIGIIVVVLWKPGLPAPPQGMRAVRCPRCNTVQNIPEAQPEYECWQCQARAVGDGQGGQLLL